MADTPELYRLNYPIETPEAYAFWASRHKANRAKAIMAFSLNLDNANDNYRRWGYPRQFRKRALFNFCMYVNNPSMAGVPFSALEDNWWDEMPYREDSLCGGGTVVPVTGVTITPKTITVIAGATTQLSATVAPANATNKSVTYKSSDATIATVSSAGLVTTLKAGSVTITVTTVDGAKTDTSVITVTAAKTYFVKLMDANTNVEVPKVGDVYQVSGLSTAANKPLTVQVFETGTSSPISGGGNNFTATGGNSSIANILGAGPTSHTATVDFVAAGVTTWNINSDAKYNATVALKVTVTAAPTPATGVTMDAFDSIYLVPNSYQAPYHIQPAGGTYDSIEFKVTTDNDVNGAVSPSATVDANGLVTLVNDNESPYVHTTIKVGSNTYHDSSHLVTSTIGITTDSFDNIPVGETRQFTWSATPSGVKDLPNAVVTYRSDDTAVATIDSTGLLTSVADGRTRIYAKITVDKASAEDSSSIGFDG